MNVYWPAYRPHPVHFFLGKLRILTRSPNHIHLLRLDSNFSNGRIYQVSFKKWCFLAFFDENLQKWQLCPKMILFEKSRFNLNKWIWFGFLVKMRNFTNKKKDRLRSIGQPFFFNKNPPQNGGISKINSSITMIAGDLWFIPLDYSWKRLFFGIFGLAKIFIG